MRFIIHNESSLPSADAIERVSIVMREGQLSIGRYGLQHCFATRFKDGRMVYCKQNSERSETFIVRDK